MQITDVPYPGLLSNGLALRREVAKALGAAQIASMSTPGGKSALAGTLQQFFLDCADLLEDLADGDAPTMTDALIGTEGANSLELRFSEAMDPGLPPMSAFVIGGTSNSPVSASWTDAETLVLTMEDDYTDESTAVVNYTPPASGALKDSAGNLLLAFGGVSATNTL